MIIKLAATARRAVAIAGMASHSTSRCCWRRQAAYLLLLSKLDSSLSFAAALFCRARHEEPSVLAIGKDGSKENGAQRELVATPRSPYRPCLEGHSRRGAPINE